MKYSNSVDIKQKDVNQPPQDFVLKGIAVGVIQNMTIEEIKKHFKFKILNLDDTATAAALVNPNTSLEDKTELIELQEAELVRFIASIEIL